MKFIKTLYNRNPVLTILGTIHLLLAIILLLYFPYNTYRVLGLNSVIKPIKFALSISFMSYTLSWILFYLRDKQKTIVYTYVTVIAMVFEQSAITYQALRGEQSHFNHASLFGIVLFALMGVFILIFTLWTAYITVLFFRQREFAIHATYLLGIRIGLTLFVVFSLFGGYIAQQPGHTVGASDGGEGICFLNWSRAFGDLRVAHFFGIHALQIIPFLGWILSYKVQAKISSNILLLVSFAYTLFVVATMVQALSGRPLL